LIRGVEKLGTVVVLLWNIANIKDPWFFAQLPPKKTTIQTQIHHNLISNMSQHDLAANQVSSYEPASTSPLSASSLLFNALKLIIPSKKSKKLAKEHHFESDSSFYSEQTRPETETQSTLGSSSSTCSEDSLHASIIEVASQALRSSLEAPRRRNALAYSDQEQHNIRSMFDM